MLRIVLLFLALGSTLAWAAPLRPYALASEKPGDVTTATAETRESLSKAGFSVIGQYAPRSGSNVLVVTHPKLMQNAAATKFGGFGAVARVSITNDDGSIEVAFTDPRWMAGVYRMNGSNQRVFEMLEQALGGAAPFGSDKGVDASKLRTYRYMMLMPYFDNRDELATHESHAAAVAAVSDNLKANIAGTRQVYKLDLPGDTYLFGVAITEGKGADATVLGNCDRNELKHTAYAPYEILVVDSTAYALPGKFRIAQSFPDLTMGTFMKISDAPGAIRKTLTQVAGGE